MSIYHLILSLIMILESANKSWLLSITWIIKSLWCAGLFFFHCGYFMLLLPEEDSLYLPHLFHMIAMYAHIFLCIFGITLTIQILLVWWKLNCNSKSTCWACIMIVCIYFFVYLFPFVKNLWVVGTMSCCCCCAVASCIWTASLYISWEHRW